jgi:signal transduction histidine kinase
MGLPSRYICIPQFRFSMRKEKIALRVLYILAAYVLLQLMWWGYQLVQLNAQLIAYQSSDLNEQYLHLRSKVWMVAGEGIVFFLLLAVGFRFLQRTVSRELTLARIEKNFLLSVTHELKTPIAAVKLFLETLQSRNLPEEKRMEILNLSLQETKRLQTLTENILLAARLDNRPDVLAVVRIDLSAMVHREVERFTKLYATSVAVEAPSDLHIEGDEQMVSVLISNLIDNAMKYGSGAGVEVVLSQQADTVQLSVRDQGPGIPLGEEKRIFEKFYRLGNEETRTSKGTGLGLFIVQAVAKMHKAEVSVSNRNTVGADFTIRFKKKINE